MEAKANAIMKSNLAKDEKSSEAKKTKHLTNYAYLTQKGTNVDGVNLLEHLKDSVECKGGVVTIENPANRVDDIKTVFDHNESDDDDYHDYLLAGGRVI